MSITVAIVGSDEPARLALVKALEAAPSDWTLQLHRQPPEEADIVVCDPGVDMGPDVADTVLVHSGTGDDLVARITDRVAPRPRVSLVTSPSGGTGATTVALHLGAELAARGHRAAVADMDTDWGLRGRLGLGDPDEVSLPVPIAGGFHLVGWPLAGTAAFDRIVVDAPRSSISRVGSVDAALLICSPTPEGTRRAQSVLDEHASVPWHVVINRVGPGGETTRTQIERALGRPVVELPACAALRDAEDDGRLLRRGWTRWSRALVRLMEHVDAA